MNGVAQRNLPEELVARLNELGCALVEADDAYTFVRLNMTGEIRIRIQPCGGDLWRVGLGSRVSDQPGRLPNPFLTIPLAGLGRSADGSRLQLATRELIEVLPRVLGESLLPAWEIGANY